MIIGRGTIAAVYVNPELGDKKRIPADHVATIDIDKEGVIDDRHHAPMLWTSGARESEMGIEVPEHEKGTKVQIPNWRRITAGELSELAKIAAALKIPVDKASLILLAADMGLNILFDGFPSFTQTPKGHELWTAAGLQLRVTYVNNPCGIPGANIHDRYPEVQTKSFVPAATGLRGLVLETVTPGFANKNEEVFLVDPSRTASTRQ